MTRKLDEKFTSGAPLLECFDATNAMKLWLNDKDIYPIELEQKKENNSNY